MKLWQDPGFRRQAAVLGLFTLAGGAAGFALSLEAGILALALCACSAKEAAFQTPEEAGEAFLTKFFTANADGRYDTFSQASAIDEAAVTAYYEGLAPYVSPDTLDLLVANRTLSRYDEFYAGKQVEVAEVRLERTEGDDFDFTVSLTVDGEAEEYTGQLSAGPLDGSYAVTRFYCGGM